MIERFPSPSWILADLRVAAGRVDIEATETIETEVEVEALNGPARDLLDEVVVAFEGDQLRVEAPKTRVRIGRTPEFAVTVRCPAGSKVRLKGASADVVARGRLGGAEIRSASGDVTLDVVDGDLRVESASGDTRVESVSGETHVQSASGDVSLGHAAGAVKAQTVSGDLRVGEGHGRMHLQTVSGDLRVDRLAGGSLELSAVSGDVDLGVVPGANVWLDVRSVSGDMSSELASGDAPSGDEDVIEIRGKTVSGDVRIRRAAA